jgi:integrase
MNKPIATPRFIVDTTGRQPRVTVDGGDRVPAPRDANPPKEVKVGSAVVLIYGRAPGPYTVAWRDSADGPRRRTTRSDWKSAEKCAKDQATKLANIRTAASQVTEADWASYTRCLELLYPLGEPIELAVAKYVQMRLALKDVSPEDCVKHYLDAHPAGYKPRPLPKLVDLYVASRERSIKHTSYVTLSTALIEFAKQFTCPLHMVTAGQINSWVAGLALAPRTKDNYRAKVVQLCRWALRNGHVPKTWDEVERIERIKVPQTDTQILRPAQFAAMLNARQTAEQCGRAHASLIPFLCIQGFAGVRHIEVVRLDWRDVHLGESYIYISKGIAKTGRDRTVPISENLAAWLRSYARENGPVVKMHQVSGAITKIKKAAGIPSGENETHNVLRKSYISYRKAVTQNIAQVAEEAGNSPQVIKQYYSRPLPAAEGKRWFAIWPHSADIIQLPLFAAAAGR